MLRDIPVFCLVRPVVNSRRTDKDLGADIFHGDPVVNMLVDITVNPLPDRVVLDPDVFGGDGFDAGKHHPCAGFVFFDEALDGRHQVADTINPDGFLAHFRSVFEA